MDLIVSVFMTDNAAFRVTRKNERMNVFKYSLASYSVLPINKAFIFCKLDTNYEKYKEELEVFVHSLFKNYELHFDRFVYQHEWIKFDIINKLESDLVWFNQNDDHVFLDSNLDMVLEGIEHLNNETTKYKSLFYINYQFHSQLSYI